MNEDFKERVILFDNIKLCQVVAINRYLGSMKEEAIVCMEELASRRVNGSLFDFENQVKLEVDKLPDFKSIDFDKKLNIGSISKVLKGFNYV